MQDGCDAAKIIISVSAEKKAVFTLTKIRIAYRHLFRSRKNFKEKNEEKGLSASVSGNKDEKKTIMIIEK